MKVLVTGAAGFIGFHTARALLARGDTVIGLDNLNDYYDVGLKRARLAELAPAPGFGFVEADIADAAAIARLFAADSDYAILEKVRGEYPGALSAIARADDLQAMAALKTIAPAAPILTTAVNSTTPVSVATAAPVVSASPL